MEDFPFDFNLSYKDEDYIVKPPPNLFKLKEMASKKYDIEIEEMVYIPENDEKMIINNEQDYADLIQYVSNHNLTEIVIYINREREEENEENDGEKEEDEEKNEEKEDDKNKKGKNKGKNKKHNKGVKEQKRIGYIIEKKQMQRDETLKEEEEKKQKKNK
jgi:hypothetical protein